MIQICVRLSLVVLVSVFVACQARKEVAEIPAPEETRVSLPPECFAGTTSLRILVDGSPIRVETPTDPRWRSTAAGSLATLQYSPSPGVELTFERDGPAESPRKVRMSASTRVAAAREIQLELVLAPAGLGSDLSWSRSAAAHDPAVVTLACTERPGRRVDSIWGRDSGLLWRWKALDSSSRWTALPSAESVSRAAPDLVGERAGVLFQFTFPSRGSSDVLEWEYESRPAIAGARTSTPRSLGGWGVAGDVAAVAAALNSVSSVARRPGDQDDGLAASRLLLEMASFPSLSTIELAASSRAETVEAVSALSRHGFRLALRVTPFGVPERKLVETPEAKSFVRDASNEPIPGGVLGEVVWDPTSTEGRDALERQVAQVLARFGDDGASTVRPRILRVSHVAEALAFYERHARRLEAARAGQTTKGLAESALRKALEAVRSAVGDGCVLAGDWNTPPQAAGLLEFSRPRLFRSDGGDLLRRDALCTLREYAFHNVIWSCEGLNFQAREDHPGGLRRRSAFRALVDLRALTGRSFFFQGVPTGLVEKRWSMIRRALPPLDCRFLDAPDSTLEPAKWTDSTTARVPPIWLLDPGAQGAESHDVVGVFNFDSFAPERITIALDRLGWTTSDSQPVLVFDRHTQSFLGAVTEKLDLLLAPRSSRLLSLHAWPEERPVLIADGRYLVDAQRSVERIEWKPDRRELSLSVRPREGKGPVDGLTQEAPTAAIHVALPETGVARVVSHRADNGHVHFERSGTHQTLHVKFDGKTPDAPVDVRLRFAEQKVPVAQRLTPRVPAPAVKVTFDPGTGGAWLEWSPVRSGQASSVQGYEVLRNGFAIGQTFDHRFLDLPEPRSAGMRDRYAVAILWRRRAADRQPGPETAIEWPSETPMALSDLAPQSVDQDWGTPGRDRGADGRALRLGGRRISSGIGVAVPSRLEYDLRGRFRRLRVRVGIDTGAGLSSRAQFRVELDGALLFESSPMRYGDDAGTVDVAVSGGRQLALVATSVSDHEQLTGLPIAVWADGVLEP